jgi:cytochrome c-type biogenesis protein CcmH
MRRRRRSRAARPLAAAVTVACALAALAPLAAARPSLPTIERQVMCVTCKIPLNVAQSPQADRERAFIAGLIAAGDGEAQIKRALVTQYGPTVLALPSTHGFDLAAYLVPLAVVVGLAATLAALLPRWRRRARAQAGAAPPSAPSAADSARLNADMAHFD